MSDARMVLAVVTLAVVMAGCATALPYPPRRQPTGLRLSADYHLLDQRVQVVLDTRGYRIDTVTLVNSDGASIEPHLIEMPVADSGPRVGGGIGASSDHGIGVGIGIGVGSRASYEPARLFFRRDQAGEPPYELHVKLMGFENAIIDLPVK